MNSNRDGVWVLLRDVKTLGFFMYQTLPNQTSSIQLLNFFNPTSEHTEKNVLKHWFDSKYPKFQTNDEN